MKFNISYDIVSFVVLMVITVKYYDYMHFPVFSNRLFGILLILGDLNLFFDILSSLFLNGVFKAPWAIVYLINCLYYVILFIMPAAILLFLIALISKKENVSRKIYYLACIPLIIFLLVFVVALPRGDVFVIGNNGEYTYGPLSSITYICAGVYFAISAIVMAVKRKSLSKLEIKSMLGLLTISLLASAIQFLFPSELLTGSAIAIAFMIMFFTTENPQLYLDPVTGVFTGDAMKELFDVQYSRRNNFHIAVIKMHGLHNIHMLYGRKAGNDALRHLSNFLLKFDNARSFRPGDALFITSFKTEKELDSFIEKYDEFKKEPQMCNTVSLKPRYTALCIKNINYFKSLREMMSVVENAFDDDNIEPIKLKTTYLTEAKILKYRSNVAIEDAIKNDISTGKHFFMVYQPIYSTKRKKFLSAEALVRYQSDSLGLVKPGDFIPLIELKGLATQLDELVTRFVFTDIKDGYFNDLGLEKIHINLSAATFSSKPAILGIIATAKKYKINPKFITFEITETASVLSEDIVLASAEILINAGFGLALDDFGTGYANIKRVAKLPFTDVKLDKVLIQETPNILKDVITLFRNLNMSIIAEGVETIVQQKMMINNGIDYIQGYYYSKPIKIDELRILMDVHEQNSKTKKGD